jgi:hypothetical protein
MKKHQETTGALEHLDNLSPEKRELLALRLRKKHQRDGSRKHTLRRVPRTNDLPVSFTQEGWLLRSQERPSMNLHVGGAFHLKGTINVAALEQSFDEIVTRHEALRTTFANINGHWVQRISPPRPQPLKSIDLRELPQPEQMAEVQRLIAEDSQRPFDRSQDILLRVTLFQLDQEEYVLALWTDHIASDGWSLEVLKKEISVLYTACSTGTPSPLPDLPIQYADFADWQRRHLRGETLEALLLYWRERLGSSLPRLVWRTDQDQSRIESHRGAWASLTIAPTSLLESLRTSSHREGTTLSVMLVAAIKALLYRYTGQDDIVVLSATTYRVMPETEMPIGVFGHGIALRTDLSGDPSFRELLRRVRETSLAAYAYQGLSFEILVKTLQDRFNLSPVSLPQVFLSIDHAAQRHSLELAGLTVDQWKIDDPGKSYTDMSLFIGEEAEGLTASVIYRTALFDDTTIKQMLVHLRTLLESIVTDPQRRLSELNFQVKNVQS